MHFGLKTLADLPKPRELEELLESGENKAEARQQMAMELQDLQERAEGPQESEDRDQPASGAEYVDADLQDGVAAGASEGTEDLEEDIEIDSRRGESSDGNDA